MCTTWASAANSGCKVVWRPGEPPGGHLWRVGRHWGPDLNRNGVPVPDHRPLTINPQHRSKRTSSKYGIWGKSRLKRLQTENQMCWMKSEICSCAQKGRANLAQFYLLLFFFVLNGSNPSRNFFVLSRVILPSSCVFLVCWETCST